MRHTLLPLAATLTALTALTAACGDDSNTASIAAPRPDTPAGDATQVVDITMEDIRFSETSMDVEVGTTVQFRFDNVGKIAHDAFVGDLDAQMQHEAEMAEMAGMSDASHGGDSHGHSHAADEPALVLPPGENGELSYTFDRPGTFEIGCHQPGHYAAGMKMQITVA